MLRFRWITFDRFKVVNLSRFYRVNFIRPYWVNFTVFSNIEEKKWLDNQEVCLLLKVSPRTLQTLRDNGTLAYTQICHKTYYKPGDVESIIRIVEERRKRAESMGRSI